jgi:hypothetical protein
MIGEAVETACPPMPPGFAECYEKEHPWKTMFNLGAEHEWLSDHPYHVKLEVRAGVAEVTACTSLTMGWSGIGWECGKSTKYEWHLRWLIKRCQRYCDRKNRKLAKGTQKMSPWAAAIRKASDD